MCFRPTADVGLTWVMGPVNQENYSWRSGVDEPLDGRVLGRVCSALDRAEDLSVLFSEGDGST